MKQTTKITVGIIVVISCFFLYFLSGSESLGEDEKIQNQQAEQISKIEEQRKKQQSKVINQTSDLLNILENQGLLGTVIIFGIIISVVIIAFATSGRMF